MRFLILCLMFVLPIPLWAQGADGSDRPGNWRVKHFETFGLWSSVCDERDNAGALEQRCYIRYVDVFSPRPDFAAIFLFVTPEPDGPQVDFGQEAGTLYGPNGFRLEQAGEVVWRTRRPGCLTGLSCTFGGEAGAALLNEMQRGGALRFTFRDRHGKSQDLSWPLAGFSDAFDDFQSQSRARGLPKG